MEHSGKIKLINEDKLRNIFQESLQKVRRRTNFNLHKPEDRYQRFINMINTNSYMRPHVHASGDDETFVIIGGACVVIIFSATGQILEAHLLDRRAGNYIIDIAGGVWHTLLALVDGTAVLEAKAGPYNPQTAKWFPTWAPEELIGHDQPYLHVMRENKVVQACLKHHNFMLATSR